VGRAPSPVKLRREAARLSQPSESAAACVLDNSRSGKALRCAALMTLMIALTNASAETRPRYGRNRLRIMMQICAQGARTSPNATPADYWDTARTLSLIGDTLVKLDALGRPQPRAVRAWQSDPTPAMAFTLRRGVKFHDGSAASPGPSRRFLAHSIPAGLCAPSRFVSIESGDAMPSLLADSRCRAISCSSAAVTRIVLPSYRPVPRREYQPGKRSNSPPMKRVGGRPFSDAVEIEFGQKKSLPRDQAIALELDKTDVVEAAPQAASGSQSPRHIYIIVIARGIARAGFSANSRAQDARLREALALAIDRNPIQSVLLKGAGEPAAGILPTDDRYSAVFLSQANPQRAGLC